MMGPRVARSRCMPDVPVAPSEPTYDPRVFPDRRTAGRMLGQALLAYAGTHPLVLGLPRGGVPVADEIARVLDGELDVWIVRKLGTPMDPELGMGAIAEGPAVVLDRAIVRDLSITPTQILRVARRELLEIQERVVRLRGDRPAPVLRDRTVIVVDDGIATGGSMRAAIRGIRKHRPDRLVVAIPVAEPNVVARLRRLVDEVVCLHSPDELYAIGLWYEDFRQVRTDEVIEILQRAALPAQPD